MSVLSPLSEEAIYCQRSRTSEDEGGETRKIEQINLVARRPELGAARHHTQELDRAEPVGEMNRQHRYEKNRGHRHACKRDKSSEQDSEAAEEFRQNGEPCHEMRRRHGHRMQDGGECFRPPGQFRQTMLYETVANNQP